MVQSAQRGGRELLYDSLTIVTTDLRPSAKAPRTESAGAAQANALLALAPALIQRNQILACPENAYCAAVVKLYCWILPTLSIARWTCGRATNDAQRARISITYGGAAGSV